MPTFHNQATLSYNGKSVSSNVTTGEIVSTLTGTKTAVHAEYSSGSELVYIISLTNSANTAVTGLTVTDDLGAYQFDTQTLVPLDYCDGSIKYFVDGILAPTPSITSTSPLTVTGISVPADGTAMLVYAARVNEFAPPEANSAITNTAVISGAGASALSVSETVNASCEPVLSITKSLSPVSVPENGEVTYTFEICNSGGAEATAEDKVSVADTFSPALSGICVSLDGVELTSPDCYTYDESTGVFETVPGEITVPAATFEQDPACGEWSCIPASATLVITGALQ